LGSLQEQPMTGREHLAVLAKEAGADPQELQAQGLSLLQELRTQGVILGTLTAGEPA